MSVSAARSSYTLKTSHGVSCSPHDLPFSVFLVASWVSNSEKGSPVSPKKDSSEDVAWWFVNSLPMYCSHRFLTSSLPKVFSPFYLCKSEKWSGRFLSHDFPNSFVALSGFWLSCWSFSRHFWSRYWHSARPHARQTFLSKALYPTVSILPIEMPASTQACDHSSNFIIFSFLSTATNFCWSDVKKSWEVMQFRFLCSSDCVRVVTASSDSSALTSQRKFWQLQLFS